MVNGFVEKLVYSSTRHVLKSLVFQMKFGRSNRNDFTSVDFYGISSSQGWIDMCRAMIHTVLSRGIGQSYSNLTLGQVHHSIELYSLAGETA